jgi:hypothetical protein
MVLSKNIVHQYFKKELEGAKILVKVDPIHFQGTELMVEGKGKVAARDLEFDDQIFDDLKADGFLEVNAMEFNLYLSGLI